jgi:hypothetical protein
MLVKYVVDMLATGIDNLYDVHFKITFLYRVSCSGKAADLY